MKKCNYCLFRNIFFFLIMVTMVPFAFAQNYADAGWVDGTAEYPLPEIDGQIDPIWEVQEIYELYPEEGLYELREDTEIPYEDDYSIQFRVMWNAEFQILYVLFEMTDDTLMTDSSGEWTPDDPERSAWFMDDACTIMLKNYLDQDLEFAWVPFTPYEHKAFNQYPEATFFQEEVVSAWAETATGYRLETSIYMDAATGLSYAANDEIPFDAQGKDDDNGEHFDYKVYFASNGPSPDGFLTLLSKENSKPVEGSSVMIERAQPEEFSLFQNYPNPFNPGTTINFQLPTESFVTLVIYNTLGQAINTLANSSYDIGHHAVNWDGTDYLGNQAPSGVYFYTLKAGEFSRTRKMIHRP